MNIVYLIAPLHPVSLSVAVKSNRAVDVFSVSGTVLVTVLRLNIGEWSSKSLMVITTVADTDREPLSRADTTRVTFFAVLELT